MKDHDDINNTKHPDNQGRQYVKYDSIVADTVVCQNLRLVINYPYDKNSKWVNQKSVYHSHVV